MQMSFVLWIAAGVGLLALLRLALGSRTRREGGPADLGSVSEHWVAEHRAGQSHDHR
jgi:hypothetical protein